MIEILCSQTFSLIYAMVIKLLIHVLLLNILFDWMDIRVLKNKILFFAFCGMLFEILSILAVCILFPNPPEARIWVYRLCMYANPLQGLFYYYVNRYAFRFTPTRAIVVAKYSILMGYIVTTLFLFLNDLFFGLFSITSKTGRILPPDYLSYIVILGVWFAVWHGIKIHLKKSGRNLIIPPQYSGRKNTHSFFRTILITSFIYAVTVFFRVYWFADVCNPVNFQTVIINFLLISAIVLYLLIDISQLRNNLLSWEMQATGTYISSLLHTNQEFRAIKDDFYNVLQGYGGYLSAKDYDGLEKYHKKLFATTKSVGDFLSIIEVLRPRIAVYSLLESMVEKAKVGNVSFSINKICDMADVVLDDIDLCRVLGILLDNAIEEAQISAHKQVNISFEQKDKQTVVLAISNTTKNEVDINMIFKEGYTTKESHSGIGLSQVVHILNNYQHCSLRVNYHDNQFTLFLILSTEAKVMV